MPYVDFSKIDAAKVGKPFERELKILLSPENDPAVKDFTLILSTLAPNGGCTDSHSHDGGELMMFISGEGKAWLDGEEYRLKPGVAIYAPPGVAHRTLNTGGEPLQILCVFIPAVSNAYVLSSIDAARKKMESGNG